jgi:hypothetical protein
MRIYYRNLLLLMVLEFNNKCRSQSYLIIEHITTCIYKIQDINNTKCHTSSYIYIRAMTDRGRLTQVRKLHSTKILPHMNIRKHNRR